MFRMVMLKKCSESLLWGTLQNCCACQRKCRRTALASKNQLAANFLQAGGSAFGFQPGVHAFSGELCDWCSTAQDALPLVRTGASPGVLRTDPAYSVFVVLRVLALRPFRNLPLYSGGSVGCSPDRMLFGTRRYRVGSDGRSSIVDASRNPTLPRLAAMDAGLIGCFYEPDVTRLEAMGQAPSWMILQSWPTWMCLLFDRGCSGNWKIPIGMHGCFRYSIAKRGQWRRSPGARRDRCEIFRERLLGVSVIRILSYWELY